MGKDSEGGGGGVMGKQGTRVPYGPLLLLRVENEYNEA